MSEEAITDYWLSVKEIIDKTCESYDSQWRRRKRVLNTKIIILMIFKIILSDRRRGLSINLTEFWDGCSDKNIDLPQPKSVTASSFCEARQKISENIFKNLNKTLLGNWDKKRSLPLWLGHRVYAIDGSKANLPRGLVVSGYKIQDEERQHYPQGLLSCLYDVLSKTVYDFDFVPHMNERACALRHLEVLEPNDVVVFDRGYISYLLLHEFHNKGVHVIFRLQEGAVNKEFEAFMKGSKTDEIIRYIPSERVIYEFKKQGYFLQRKPISFRLIKHIIKGETYLYGTTLFAEKYPAECFYDLYHERWGIEELYKISKDIVNIEEFHSKTERGVKQEIYAHLLLINLSRFFEFDAQDRLPPMEQQDKEACNRANFYKFFNPASLFNINFKNCLMVVGRYVVDLFLSTCKELEHWTGKVIRMILRVRQKIRPGRSFPRRSYKPTSKWERGRSKKPILKLTE